MRLPRACGLLLHPTSLPGPFGVGDLGPAADDFVQFLAETGQTWWQMLPIGPIGGANSPYQSSSSFAGNPLLISSEQMLDDNLLNPGDLGDRVAPSLERVAFEQVAVAKMRWLRIAFTGFPTSDPAFETYCAEQARWLDDYALYVTLKEAHRGRAWTEWPRALARREPSALARWRERLAAEIRFVQFTQFVFDRQWRRLRRFCQAHRVRLIGDVPIFVSHDSADVWTHPELFELDKAGQPTHVAGVPPDYFSATGQLWGNPLYRWPAHEAESYSWWLGRLRHTLDRFDLIRLDHFRGFEAFWSVPATAKTAASGSWCDGPGAKFFEAIRQGLGGLPMIAEDLGDITPAVQQLRDQFDLPGMRVLHFAFDSDSLSNPYLPFHYTPHCLVYTGTHDNDTTLGWFEGDPSDSPAQQAHTAARRARVLRFLGTDGSEIHWKLIRSAFQSVAETVIIPVQDVLGLGRDARMNVPGQADGNWGWRLRPGVLDRTVRDRLAELTQATARWNDGLTPCPATSD